MQLRYAIFGESHGPAIGVVVENLPAGIPVEMDFIRRELNRRRARAGFPPPGWREMSRKFSVVFLRARPPERHFVPSSAMRIPVLRTTSAPAI